MRTSRRVRIGGIGRAAALAAVLVFALGALPVSALTIQMPSPVISPADVAVRLDAGETTGTVVLRDGAVVVGQTDSTEGVAAFPGVVLGSGNHTLRATLSAAGEVTKTSEPVTFYAWGAPADPKWVTPLSSVCVSPVKVRAKAGAATATMTLSVNGRPVRSLACRPGQTVDFGTVKLSKGRNRLAVESVSLSGQRTTSTRTAKRHEWRYNTCIVVDKSQHRLYWVRDQQLVKIYPIADGKHNGTPVRTWRILAKYKTNPKGIYGPRKMRLFKRVGRAGHRRWVFTAYGIHGTNQPWVIGTQASHGCIRMYNKDVLDLWPQVRLGTYVITRA